MRYAILFVYMDELEISGKRYISSVRAAKEHKYHSDYIGQLIRGGKVVGQKVGRAWYVEAKSLAEYLGKEVPARGPVAKKVKPEPIAVEEKIPAPAIASKIKEFEEAESEAADLADDSNQNEPASEPEFLMPLRKSGRAHVIAAIGEAAIKAPKEISIEPVVEKKIEVEKEPEIKEEEVVQPEVKEPEEENFIPLKISKEEPEDSFYKVSRKGLRYVEHAGARAPKEKPRAATSVHKKDMGRKAAAAISFALVAGMVSLGAGVLMSYYLHSVTTVQDAAQTSSVILSN